MAGLGVKLYTDEHIDPALAVQLRQVGYDTQSTQEAGLANQNVGDEDQLIYAAGQGRALLTFNIADFIDLDREWKASGRAHAGIIVSAEITNFAELFRRVKLHLDTYPPTVQDNIWLWLAK